jgi:hypothetical protein
MKPTISHQTLALHIVRYMAIAQQKGRLTSLDGLVEALKVRRTDVRAVLSKLHAQDYLNVATMSLTLRGFFLGASLTSAKLPAIRAPRPALAAVPSPTAAPLAAAGPPSSRPGVLRTAGPARSPSIPPSSPTPRRVAAA